LIGVGGATLDKQHTTSPPKCRAFYAREFPILLEH
jgi:hypothetical protein